MLIAESFADNGGYIRTQVWCSPPAPVQGHEGHWHRRQPATNNLPKGGQDFASARTGLGLTCASGVHHIDLAVPRRVT